MKTDRSPLQGLRGRQPRRAPQVLRVEGRLDVRPGNTTNYYHYYTTITDLYYHYY